MFKSVNIKPEHTLLSMIQKTRHVWLSVTNDYWIGKHLRLHKDGNERAMSYYQFCSVLYYIHPTPFLASETNVV